MTNSESSSSTPGAPSVLQPSVLQLWVHGLFDPTRALLEELERPPRVPGLRRLLGRGIAGSRHGSAALTALWQGQVPAGALGRYGQGLSLGEQPWMRADPVHLQTGQDHALLWDAETLDLSADEADAILETLNTHFAPDGLHFERGTPEQWYVGVPAPVRAETWPPEHVSGRNAFHFLPGGAEGARLRAWLNEAQMLLHDHPVNRARRNAGAPELSGIWFWGAGSLESPGTLPVDTVWTEDAVLGGVARLEGIDWQAVPQDFARWAACAAGRRHGVELKQGAAATRQGDPQAWLEAVEAFDRDWLVPALDFVDRGRLQELQVFGILGPVAHVYRPRHRWCFWRRSPNPVDWLASAAESPR